MRHSIDIGKIAVLAAAVALFGCRRHPAAILPPPVSSRSETLRPDAEKRACQPARWRQVTHHAFGERETWPFEVHWGVVKAGQAVLAVEGIEPIRGRPAYHLSMDIRATGLAATVHPFHDRTDSWLDRASLTTLLIRHSVRESHYQADETLILDPDCRRFQKRKERLDKPEKEERQGSLPANTLDVYGILFYLRTQPLAPGQSYDLELFTGDKVVPVTAFVRQKERLKVGAGAFACFRVEMVPRNASLAPKIQQVQWWIGADDKHPPVRIRMDIALGHITADLSKP